MDREKQTRPIDDPKQRENGSEDVARGRSTKYAQQAIFYRHCE
jgi:hypothetical protein